MGTQDSVTARYRVVTPLFLGGADREARDFRIPSFKGVLHQSSVVDLVRGICALYQLGFPGSPIAGPNCDERTVGAALSLQPHVQVAAAQNATHVREIGDRL
jgi:hypothetical protein